MLIDRVIGQWPFCMQNVQLIQNPLPYWKEIEEHPLDLVRLFNNETYVTLCTNFLRNVSYGDKV